MGVEFVITEKLIKITISDTGMGIPSDEVGNIYKPFQRASNVRFIGGFGIGLSLVSKIIEIHDAALEIRSKENEGTTIQLSFKRLR